MTEYSGVINLLSAACTFIFCFSPLFVLQHDKAYTTDDAAFLRVENFLAVRDIITTAPLFVILVPLADILLDYTSNIMSFLSIDEKSTKIDVKTAVVRLTETERLLFIIGVASQSAICFLPISTDAPTVGIVHSCTDNASIILLLFPIINFLERCTTTFTEMRTKAVIIPAILGTVLLTMSNFFRSNLSIYENLLQSGSTLLTISGIVYLSIMLICLYNYCSKKLYAPQDRTACVASILNCVRRTLNPTKDAKNRQFEIDSELYTNYVPAFHMISSVIIAISNFGVLYSPTDDLRASYQRKNSFVLIAEILVLVIELRIRKNEIARGQIALLDSKKSYVRYISHELRTPLNTAFLGLKLLTSELKTSKDPNDVERYDTLCDVNMSCMAAVDILNDLLCYEKLESGILELHKENITIEPFLNDCMSMFSVQARECGVTTNIITEALNGDEEVRTDDTTPVILSLLPDDSIFADKFKMDQVIRNLISNALKFTPRGGNVTIKATFVYNLPDEVSRYEAETRSFSTVLFPPPLSRFLSWRSILEGFWSTFSCISHPGAVANYPDSNTISTYSKDAINGKLIIVVTDTGVGISQENQLRLFKGIVQFSPDKLQAGGGSGLGLWISSGIMELHDGKISVSSDGEGMGSSFTVEMPMLRFLKPQSPDFEDLPSPRSPPHSPPRSSPHSIYYALDSNSVITALIGEAAITSMSHVPPTSLSIESFSEMESEAVRQLIPIYHVLVVDDSRLNRKMLLKCLRADGHICEEGADGLEAIDMVKDRIDYTNGGRGKPFDAILMDFIMPNMDGPTATKEIRALGYTAPIFGVTGNGLPSDIEYFLSCGADKVLLKPLDVSAFGQAMRELKLR